MTSYLVGYRGPPIWMLPPLRSKPGGEKVMPIDFAMVQRIAEPLIGGVLLALALRALERRPRVVVFYGHVGAFQLQPSAHGPGGAVHTHSIVIRNSGKLTAHNVRVAHTLPLASPTINVSVHPQTFYTQTTLPTGGDEILFGTLVTGATGHDFIFVLSTADLESD